MDRKNNEIRAVPVPDVTAITLQAQVMANVKPNAKKYTDQHYAYEGLPNHESVNHGVGEYVRKNGAHELCGGGSGPC